MVGVVVMMVEREVTGSEIEIEVAVAVGRQMMGVMMH